MFDATLKTIADQLIAANREGPEATLSMVKQIYADDVVSVEAAAMPNDDGTTSAEARGKAAIEAKHAWFDGAFEVHSTNTEGPFIHAPSGSSDGQFAIIYDMDITNKATGDREKSREIGVYTVKGGKITREEFYYAA